MLAVIARGIKRFLILVPGLIIGWFAYTDLFPAFNKKLPALIALIITYLLAAYVLIPLGIRAFRIFVRPKHLPLYSTTPDGLASDPLNIALVGTKNEIIKIMKKAGWHQADRRTIRTIPKLIMSVILKRPYPNAPFSNLFLFGRNQDLGFQLPIAGDPSNRHHVRFWAVDQKLGENHIDHMNFWLRFQKPSLQNKQFLWVGAASRDTGLGIIRHNMQLTHMIDPDTNAERNFIVRDLEKKCQISKFRLEKIGEPYKLTNRVLTGYLKADGFMAICEL